MGEDRYVEKELNDKVGQILSDGRQGLELLACSKAVIVAKVQLLCSELLPLSHNPCCC